MPARGGHEPSTGTQQASIIICCTENPPLSHHYLVLRFHVDPDVFPLTETRTPTIVGPTSSSNQYPVPTSSPRPPLPGPAGTASRWNVPVNMLCANRITPHRKRQRPGRTFPRNHLAQYHSACSKLASQPHHPPHGMATTPHRGALQQRCRDCGHRMWLLHTNAAEIQENCAVHRCERSS